MIATLRIYYLHIPAIPLHKSPMSLFLLRLSFNLMHFSNLWSFRSARARNFSSFVRDRREVEPNGALTAFRTMRCLLFCFLYGDFLLRLCDDSPIQISGKSGKPGTPSDVVFCASGELLAFIEISLIELLYKLG